MTVCIYSVLREMMNKQKSSQTRDTKQNDTLNYIQHRKTQTEAEKRLRSRREQTEKTRINNNRFSIKKEEQNQQIRIARVPQSMIPKTLHNIPVCNKAILHGWYNLQNHNKKTMTRK